MKQIHGRKETLEKKFMHWPRKIHTREMLTKETHAAEKFPTPPNTFLMVRFKCCFSMNIISVIQFVLKLFFSFSLSTLVMVKVMSSISPPLTNLVPRAFPLKNGWGGKNAPNNPRQCYFVLKTSCVNCRATNNDVIYVAFSFSNCELQH